MKLSVTEQTTTFPVPIDELANFLNNNAAIGYKWETPLGVFEIKDTAQYGWIVANAHTSQFSNQRCYIYNKAFYEAFVNPVHLGDANYIGGLTMPQSIKDIHVNQQNIFDKIREWAHAKGIYRHGDPKTCLQIFFRSRFQIFFLSAGILSGGGFLDNFKFETFALITND